jgi:hypothetical protein
MKSRRSSIERCAMALSAPVNALRLAARSFEEFSKTGLIR